MLEGGEPQKEKRALSVNKCSENPVKTSQRFFIQLPAASFFPNCAEPTLNRKPVFPRSSHTDHYDTDGYSTSLMYRISDTSSR